MVNSAISPRCRFHNAMRFKAVDRLPILTWGLWKETEQRWLKEGMKNVEEEFSLFDGPMQSCWLYGKFQGPIPQFDEILLEETNQYQDFQNYIGQVERRFKEQTSMPHFQKYPVACRKDWEEYKRRFNPSSPGRYPADWDIQVQKRISEAACEIRGLAAWGYYGFLREMFGPENLSYMYYDDPNLIAEMNEFWEDYTIRRLEKGIRAMEFDYALIWEDNCYNHGMLHSPDIFKKFMAPHYRRLVEFFNRQGIDIISVDSDGNVTELIPLLLEVGVTAIHPFEVAAGMDVVKIGKEYPELQIWGGIDKRALAMGPAAIDAELKRVIPAMKKRGGYAAGLDHNIPSDISLENHRYYMDKLMEMARC